MEQEKCQVLNNTLINENDIHFRWTYLARMKRLLFCLAEGHGHNSKQVRQQGRQFYVI